MGLDLSNYEEVTRQAVAQFWQSWEQAALDAGSGLREWVARLAGHVASVAVTL